MTRHLLIAGTQSGVGKTTIVAGLCAALRRRGLTVQPFKVGPDYIDPTYHALAAGRNCRNLDSWLLPHDRLRELYDRHARVADVAFIEGVMGLHDGASYEGDTGSSAEVAKLLDVPVVLVIDASRMARSIGAIGLGYARFDPDVRLAGFLINRVAGERHARGVESALARATGLPVFGCLPRSDAVTLPERHLGLVPTVEAGAWDDFIDQAADLVTKHVDLDALLAASKSEAAAPNRVDDVCANAGPREALRPVIAVARDEAFQFLYEDNLEQLQVTGAKLAFFSPLHDTELPRHTAGVFLSGGFPELHGARLSANVALLEALRLAHADGMPIYAECGGLMVLTEAIIDLHGVRHPMAGVLPGTCRMTGRLTLGYRRAEVASAGGLFLAGACLRGHEFHYSAWEGRPDQLSPAYMLRAANGDGPAWPEGACVGNLHASYVHLNFLAHPELAERFVAACASWQDQARVGTVGANAHG